MASASRSIMQRVVKPRTARAKRALAKREPQPVERLKRSLFMRGGKSSAALKRLLGDLHALCRHAGGEPVSRLARRHAEARSPLDPASGGEAALEEMAGRSDCGLLALGTHSKKRPDNLVLGRMYDGRLYDAVEAGVQGVRPIAARAAAAAAGGYGSKPCFVFAGAEFESSPNHRQLKSLLLDMFRGLVVDAVNLKGLDRAIVCTAVPGGRVLFRHCRIKLKKSGTTLRTVTAFCISCMLNHEWQTPRIELEEIGPSMDLVLRRTRTPSADLEREAMKLAPKPAHKKVKNVSTDALVGKVGRIYVPKQQLQGMAVHKMKGTKRERRESNSDARKQLKSS
eukprot:jgi/Chlat1/4320/Chrsp29S08899